MKKQLWIAVVAAAALATAPLQAAEATFDRTLSVGAPAQLSVSTGSGNIHITRGSGSQIHIFGRIKTTCWGINCASEQLVRQIAANPPIEQTGSIVRIGSHHENLHNISIDYEIQAPGNSYLDASAGSGDINVQGVGESAKLSTGSGNIRATGLHGGFKLDTGSGNIYAEQTGQGDVKAQTGSGNIELRNLRGGRRAGLRLEARNRLRQRRTLDWKCGVHAGRQLRLGRHPFRPGDRYAGLAEPPPDDRQAPRRRPHGPHPDRIRRHSHSLTVE